MTAAESVGGGYVLWIQAVRSEKKFGKFGDWVIRPIAGEGVEAVSVTFLIPDPASCRKEGG